MTSESLIKIGDCLPLMKKMNSGSVDLVYLDPPFFTNKTHSLTTRDRSKKFSFEDIWYSHKQYAEFILARLMEAHRLLSDSGSVFLHCDKNASHILRAILNEAFGEENFQSEIVWSYRRWSNAAKGLMPSHQTIFFYSKTSNFTFNKIYIDYSETTNVDQILQKRSRDEHGKSVYARSEDGNIITCAPKKGVPLGDVWEIPFLNPKAKERTGYPTQKPLILLERIILLTTNPGGTVLDPFCGSGTTLVAASLLGRKSIGFDTSPEAIKLTEQRILNPIKTESKLLEKGRDAYRNANTDAISFLTGIDFIPIHRNSGIDAILKVQFKNRPVPIRVQRISENISEAAHSLYQAATKKGAKKAFLVRTQADAELSIEAKLPKLITVIDAPSAKISSVLSTETFDTTSGKVIKPILASLGGRP